MTIIIKTTNNYPHYDRKEEKVNEENAMRRFDEISKELNRKVNNGELQDYDLCLLDK